MPDVMGFLPTELELFPEEEAMTVEDLRALQKNPVFMTIIQRLRAAAYHAAMQSEPQLVGLKHAIAVIGYTEYDLQREPENPSNVPGIDADEIGFDE